MRTLVCTACGRYTSRYADRCPFCKQRNLVMLDSYNADSLRRHPMLGPPSSSGSGILSSLLMVAILATGMTAFLYIWIHPSTETKNETESKLISTAVKPPDAKSLK